MSQNITLDLEPKFEVGDRVKVVVSNSPFWWWDGEVIAVFERNTLEFQKVHYHVIMDYFKSLKHEEFHSPLALLFYETDLAHAL